MIPTELAAALVEIGQRMDARGWVPGSAGNLSARIDNSTLAITRSGVHKGRLSNADIMAVRMTAATALIPGQKPSAETLLHCQLYRLFPQVGAVLHGHSVAATVLSMQGAITFSNYEILKAFGFATHELDVTLPVYENDQDIARLAAWIEPLLVRDPPIGYVIAGHGVYAWGSAWNTPSGGWRRWNSCCSCELERRQHEMSRLTVYRRDLPGTPAAADRGRGADRRRTRAARRAVRALGEPGALSARRIERRRSWRPTAPIWMR